MPGAGEMSERVRFSRRGKDGYGRDTDTFEMQFEVWAKVTWPKGSEAAMQSRLQGVQPVALTIRTSNQARDIDTSWRAEVLRFGGPLNITAVAATPDRAFIELLAQADGNPS